MQSIKNKTGNLTVSKFIPITMYIFVIFLLISSTATYAQNSIQGDIADWSNGAVPLVFNDYMTKEKITMGEVTSEGKMTIPLEGDFLIQMKEAAEKAKEKAPEGWKIKFKTVESTFGCTDEGFIYKNATAIITGLPDLEAIKEGTISYGYLYSTNDPRISTWLHKYGEGNIAKGYYLKWFFVENDASAKGACHMPTYTGNDDENYTNTTAYNLDLQKGWNIVKYAITETFTSKTGKIAPSKTEITTIDKVPDDIQWKLVSD